MLCDAKPALLATSQGQAWFANQAHSDYASFREQDVRACVAAMIEDLLVHCYDETDRVCFAAHTVLHLCGRGEKLQVNQLISDGMTRLLESLLHSSTRHSFWRYRLALGHLASVVRTIERPQRQRWMMLLVDIFLSKYKSADSASQAYILWNLSLLWRLEPAPAKIFASAVAKLECQSPSEAAWLKPWLND